MHKRGETREHGGVGGKVMVVVCRGVGGKAPGYDQKTPPSTLLPGHVLSHRLSGILKSNEMRGGGTVGWFFLEPPTVSLNTFLVTATFRKWEAKLPN